MITNRSSFRYCGIDVLDTFIELFHLLLSSCSRCELRTDVSRLLNWSLLSAWVQFYQSVLSLSSSLSMLSKLSKKA